MTVQPVTLDTRSKEHYSYTYREHFDAMIRRGALFIKDGDAYDTETRWTNRDNAGANEASAKVEVYVLKDLEGLKRDYDYREELNKRFPQEHPELDGKGDEWHAVPLKEIPAQYVDHFEQYKTVNIDAAMAPIIEWLKAQHVEIFAKFSKKNKQRSVKWRKLQTTVIDRVAKRRAENAGSITIISELAPRFGKTICYLGLFKKLFEEHNIPVMMVPAYWLGAISSYEKELANDYRDFSNFVYVDTGKHSGWEMTVASAVASKKPVVIGISLYGKYEDFVTKHSWFSQCNGPVLIVPEEADYGVHTERQQDKLKFLMSGKECTTVITSGTNIDRMSKGVKKKDICDVISIPYSALEQQSDDSSIVKRKMYQVKVSERVQQLVAQYSDEDRPCWSKVLEKSAANSNFIKEFFKGLYDYSSQYGFGINSVTEEDIRVSIVFVNTTNDAMKKLQKLVQPVLTDHKIVVINGDETDGRNAEKMVKQELRLIKQGFVSETNLIILTNNMCSRSFSVGDIQACVFLTDGGALDTYIQKQSRCLTPIDDKEIFLVSEKSQGHILSYSFEPNRTTVNQLQYLYEAKRLVDIGLAGNISEGVTYVLNSMNLRQVGFLQESSVEDVTAEMLLLECEESEKILRVAGMTTDYDAILGDEYLLDLLSKCSKFTAAEKKHLTSALKKGKNRAKKENDETPSSRNTLNQEEKKALAEVVEKIKSILYSSTTVIMYTNLSGDTFDGCLKIIDSDITLRDNFTLLYGLSPTEMMEFIPYLPVELLDMSIYNSKQKYLGNK